jgi:hypothetical protein
LLVTLGDYERNTLDRAKAAGRPGYWDAVTAMLDTAADVIDEAGSVDEARHILGIIAADILETVRQARVYVRKVATT